MEERLLAMQKAAGSNPVSRSFDIFSGCDIVKSFKRFFASKGQYYRMSTDQNLIRAVLAFLLASIASISIFTIGFSIEPDSSEMPNSIVEMEDFSAEEESFSISSTGIISPTSSSGYHKPQALAMNNPDEEKNQVKKSLTVELTGYSSTVDQTNSQPCITANGFDVCSYGKMGTVAANFLEFGTEIKMPEHFGDKVFVVRDRMNTRYDRPSASHYKGYIDIWFPTRQEAQSFGRIKSEIKILE